MSDPPRPARLIDVARATGVSVATVSNVLNRPHKVGAEVTRRILDAMRELDYVPHAAATRLRRGTGGAIGLVLPDVANSFYAGLARGAADAAYDRGGTLILCDSADDEGRESEFLRMLVEQRVAAALVAPVSADGERLERLRRRGVRLVVVDRSVPVAEGCSVAVDDVAGGALAARHLASRGAARILLVNGPEGVQQCRDRWIGARDAADAAGIDAGQLVVDAAMTAAHGREAALRMLEGPLPSAVFATNDLLALGILQVLGERRIRVPEEIAVVGYGDLDVAQYAPVPLTTVAQPVDELGATAVRLASDEISRGAEHRHERLVLEPELIVRSTA